MKFPEDIDYRLAKKKVKRKKAFFNHLVVYLVVNTVFSLVTLFSGEPFGWFPIWGFWGIGLAIHYVKIFGIPGTGILTSEWEEREIEKEMGRSRPRMESPAAEGPEIKEKLELKELRKNYDERDLV